MCKSGAGKANWCEGHGLFKTKAMGMQRKSCIRTMAYWLNPQIQNEQSVFVSLASTLKALFLILCLFIPDDKAFRGSFFHNERL